MDSICYLADGMEDVNRLTSFVQARFASVAARSSRQTCRIGTD